MPDSESIVRLQELIIALDSRRAQPERVAEARIARDAQDLRAKALSRLAELQSGCPTDA